MKANPPQRDSLRKHSFRRAYLGLGSNLDDRESCLTVALSRLSDHFDLLAHSSIYETTPVGYTDQQDFLNMAAEFNIKNHNPLYILSFVKKIESDLGRVDGRRWGPRPIDIDILYIETTIVHTDTLTVPHPEMFARNFVLVPLSELTPLLWIDGQKHVLADYIRKNERERSDRVTLYRRREKIPAGVKGENPGHA